MIVLYIFLALAAIILFLLLIDISLVFTYKEGFKLKVKIFIFPLPVEKLAELASGEDKNGRFSSEGKPQKAAKKKKSVSDIIELISTVNLANMK